MRSLPETPFRKWLKGWLESAGYSLDDAPKHLAIAYDKDDPAEMVWHKPGDLTLWHEWMQHKAQLNRARLDNASKYIVGPRGGVYYMTASGRRYI